MFALSQRAHIASIFNVPASLVQLRELFGTNDKAMYDPSFMVESFQSLVVGLHDFVGFGWAPTLLVCATGFRIMTLPLYVSLSLLCTKIIFLRLNRYWLVDGDPRRVPS